MYVPRYVLLLAALAWSSSAKATDYFLNDASTAGDVATPGCAQMGPGADTSSCGSCGSPCATVQFIYDSKPLTGGDSVYLNTGVYKASGTASILDANDPAKSGSAGAALRFVGPANANGRARRSDAGIPLALLDGDGTASAGVYLEVPGIRLESFGITNLTGAGCTSTGQLCGSAVRIREPTLISWFEVSGLEIYGLSSSGANAIDVDQTNTDCTRCLVQNNYFHDSPKCVNAVYFSGMGGMEISGNEVNHWSTVTGLPNAAVAIWGSGSGGASIHNNIFINNVGSAIQLRTCASNQACSGRLSANVSMRSNTFRQDNLGGAFAEVDVGDGTGHTLSNDIFEITSGFAFNVGVGGKLTSDYNGFSLSGTAGIAVTTTTYPDLEDWRTTGQDAHSLAAAAAFVSVTDSHLTSPAGHHDENGALIADASLSPFVDRGNPSDPVATELQPNGGRIDLGAYGNTRENALTPISLRSVSGDLQTGAPFSALPSPLRLRAVYDSTQGPAAGVAIAFLPSSVAASCSPTNLLTDVNGMASVTALLGAAGAQSFAASAPDVRGAPAVIFQALAGAQTDGGHQASRRLSVGCGCQAGPSGDAGFMLVAAAALAFMRKGGQSPPATRRCRAGASRKFR